MTDVIEPWTPLPDGVWLALRHFVEPYVGARFFVPGDPVPKKRRVGQGRASFTPARTAAAEKAVAAAFKAAMPGWKPEPDRTYGCMIEFRTESGSQVDIDNGTKLVLDALNKVFWDDDIQVGKKFVDLQRRGDPGTEVLLFAVEPNGTKITKVCECGRRFRSTKNRCVDCTKRIAVVNALLAPGADEVAEQLDRDRRAVFSLITAHMIGHNVSPSPATIAQRLTAQRGERVTEHRVRAVIETLVSDGFLARQDRNPKLKIVKPLGVAA